MDNAWIASFLTADWGPAIAGFLFGLTVGWLVWGVGRERAPGRARADMSRPAAGDLGADDAGGKGRVEDLQREIIDAKRILAQAQNDTEAVNNEIQALDEAVNRANGRLKVVARSFDQSTGR